MEPVAHRTFYRPTPIGKWRPWVVLPYMESWTQHLLDIRQCKSDQIPRIKIIASACHLVPYLQKIVSLFAKYKNYRKLLFFNKILKNLTPRVYATILARYTNALWMEYAVESIGNMKNMGIFKCVGLLEIYGFNLNLIV